MPNHFILEKEGGNNLFSSEEGLSSVPLKYSSTSSWKRSKFDDFPESRISVETGNVLAVYQRGNTIRDNYSEKRGEMVTLPDADPPKQAGQGNAVLRYPALPNVSIRFVGLFDTVGSLFIPGNDNELFFDLFSSDV